MSPIEFLTNAATVFGMAFFLFLPIELWKRKQDKTLTKRSVAEMAANASPLLGVVALNGVVVAFITTLFSALATLAPWSIETSFLNAAICLVFSVNPINVHFHEAKNLVNDLRAAQSFGEIIHHFFSRPGALWISKQLDERRAT
jgi:hypothetical protein